MSMNRIQSQSNTVIWKTNWEILMTLSLASLNSAFLHSVAIYQAYTVAQQSRSKSTLIKKIFIAVHLHFFAKNREINFPLTRKMDVQNDAIKVC